MMALRLLKDLLLVITRLTQLLSYWLWRRKFGFDSYPWQIFV